MCFSDEEVITVGSSAYNLAGDLASRDNFMKNSILNMIFSGASKGGLGKGIITAHTAGPATTYTRFYNWAESSGYNNQVGNYGGLVYSTTPLTEAGFGYLVPVKATHDQRSLSFTVSAKDMHLIALEWIINNAPEKRNTVFTVELEKTPGLPSTFTGRVVINYTGGTTDFFTPTYNLSNNMPFVYLYHEERLKASSVTTDTGWITGTPPARVGFIGDTVVTAESVVQDETTTTVTSYSNSTPTTTVAAIVVQNLAFDKITGTYTKVTTVAATSTVDATVTTEVQGEESFYTVLFTDTTTSSSEVVLQNYGSNLYSSTGILTDAYINFAGAIVTPSASSAFSISGKIPISTGQILQASTASGGVYAALYDASDVYIAGSATSSNNIAFMAGASYARFTYFTADVGSYTIHLAANVTVTTTITVSTPSLQVYWKYKQVSTVVIQKKWLPYFLKIYQKGSSSTGDALLFNTSTAVQKFFPVIPLRRDNVMVDVANFPTQYDWNRKAFRKAFGSKKKYNTILDSLNNNPALNDIDHAWVVFGVSLSTQQQDGQKYLYEFFKNLSDTTVSLSGAHKSASAFSAAWDNFIVAIDAFVNDETGTVVRPAPPTVQEYTLTVSAAGGLQDWLYNTTITARGGSQVVGSGYHIKSLNKIGQSWVYAKSTLTLPIPTYNNAGNLDSEAATTTVIAFGKQITDDSWVEYEFFDLVHTNSVHQGITAITLGTTAIASANENSSFIVPLQETVFTNLTLVRKTQLSLESAFLVINYYDKQVVPWYASGFFQIVLVVVIIVIAVYTGYISPESLGLFGANAAVGTTLGFTGIAATIAGALANAVAASIVSALITKVSVKALGEDFGRFVGLIASMITINLMTSSGPFDLAGSWAQMTKADNLINLTMGGVQQYGAQMQSAAMKINANTQALLLTSNKALAEIHRLTKELMGDTGVNPAVITDAIRYATENSAQFINRTTMTGTEIATISIKLVEDFPVPQLALPYLD